MRLWEQKSTKEVYKFQSTGLNYEVKDVTWSQCLLENRPADRFSSEAQHTQQIFFFTGPNNSTVFGCVTEDGRIQLWDILVDVVEPVVQVELKRELTVAEKAAATAKEQSKVEFREMKKHGHVPHSEEARHAGETAIPLSTPSIENGTSEPAERAKRQLTCIKFAENSPVVVVGDSDGRVDVMRIENMMIKPCSVAEHKRNLKHAMFPETFGSSE